MILVKFKKNFFVKDNIFICVFDTRTFIKYLYKNKNFLFCLILYNFFSILWNYQNFIVLIFKKKSKLFLSLFFVLKRFVMEEEVKDIKFSKKIIFNEPGFKFLLNYNNFNSKRKNFSLTLFIGKSHKINITIFSKFLFIKQIKDNEIIIISNYKYSLYYLISFINKLVKVDNF